MNSFFTYTAIILVWILSFVEPSGWGTSIHLADKVNLVIVVFSIYFFFQNSKHKLRIPDLIIFGLIVTFIILPFLTNNSFDGGSYLISFLLTYNFLHARMSPRIIKYSGITVALMGIIVLLIYYRGNILSGWNDNAISMVGLFSFLYFSIFLVLRKGTRAFWRWNIVTLIYIYLLFNMDCRSGMLFSVISVIAIFRSDISRSFLFKKNIILHLPLLIALCIITISETHLFSILNTWSIGYSGKEIFNGRNDLWRTSLQLLSESHYLGTGKFLLNYHNSGIAALSTFGIFGYFCWISYFKFIFKQYLPYLSDSIVFGCMLSFVLIFLQQSVDLGFISPAPNRLPYMILGCGLGRIFLIRDLKKEKEYDKCNCSCI